jgi:glutamyl-tRNA synthetase
MLCSTVDDIDYNISHVIRGEDHDSNTAIQIQMFEALGCKSPEFGHLSLVKSKEDKISKRVGGFEIKSLREEEYLEPISMIAFFALIGSNQNIFPAKNIAQIIEEFDITNYSKSPTTYIQDDLLELNHKILISYKYEEILPRLKSLKLEYITKEFWHAAKQNLKNIMDIKEWWDICHEPLSVEIDDKELLKVAIEALPCEIDENSWKNWTKSISKVTGKKGKELFMPLRLALTGKDNGPELKNLLFMLDRTEILKRLKG